MTGDLDPLRKLDKTLDALLKNKERTKVLDYRPYPKQMLFHKMGATKVERLLSAGNQLGKTLAGAHEMTFHLTGIYPQWWEGRMWDRPVRAWVGGESGEVVRDTSQKMLFGDLTESRDNLGTGIIPADCIVNIEWSRGVANAIDTAAIKHKGGGTSKIKFKTYEMRREKWQGDTLDIVWLDEEPPIDLYTEAYARRTATRGMMYLTFTPLKGMSTVVKRFKLEANKLRGEVIMTYNDAAHISKEALEEMLSGYPTHEHECRINGVPMQGEGRIYQFADATVSVPPFKIPEYWPRVIGADFGHGDHPTAAAWLAWDRERDVVYCYRTYREPGRTIAENAAALNSGGRIPVSWPPDLLQKDRVSANSSVKSHYEKQFCWMLPSHAINKDGSTSIWSGVVEIQQRIERGQFKVFSDQHAFFEEFRNYHMDDGKIVKKDDDLLDAVRYGIMGLKHARVVDESWYPGANKSVLDRVKQPAAPFNPLEF